MLQSLLTLAILGQPLQYDPSWTPQQLANLISSQPNPQAINNLKDADGARWIHRAVENLNIAHVRILAYLGPSQIVNAKDDKGQTPLHWACHPMPDSTPAGVGRYTILCHLLMMRADPDIQDEDGRTPLHLTATTMRGANYGRTLLLFGADPNLKDSGGKMAKDVILESNNIYGAQLLLQGLQIIGEGKGWYHGASQYIEMPPEQRGWRQSIELFPAPEGVSNPQAHRRQNPLHAAVMPGYPNPVPGVQPQKGKIEFYIKTRRKGWQRFGLLEAPFERATRGMENMSRDFEGVMEEWGLGDPY